ncbi:hypothetical protein LRY65_03580 [Candidatus Woesebacteria bacterium]|nr:hypothetical protein [Candidatus Woesebacteria bacterium]
MQVISFRRIFFVLLIASIAVVSIGWLFLQKYKNAPNIQFISDTNYDITIDKSIFHSNLYSFNIFSNGILTYRESSSAEANEVAISKVVFELVSDPQENNKIFEGIDAVEVSSLSSENNDQILFVKWYVNNGYVQNLPEQEKNSLISTLLLQNLYYLEHKPIVVASSEYQQFIKAADSFRKETRYFLRYGEKKIFF